LAAEVRQILGPDTRISYAADWSEYFGYHDAFGNLQFHLDPLWADPNIDFIGIDNYMPLSDWREGENHADAAWGSIYDLGYLKANIAGGEGFDWYYDDPEGEAAQRRVPITDGAHGEPWVFRYKDLRSWWSNAHHDRVDGQRSATSTAWQPMSKPIVFTEIGCPAIDKGTNEPNKFLDPKSSESKAPKYSTGRRDDLIQLQYLRAMAEFWDDPANNPVSPLYGSAMVDAGRAHVWAWDARPFPFFPNLAGVWSDGDNYARGHWLNGRATGQVLASVVADLCERSGLTEFDASGLFGVVRGYGLAGLDTARSALQPLMLAYGFDAVERDGVLRFVMRDARRKANLVRETLVRSEELEGPVELTRSPEAEMAGRVRLSFIEAEGNFDTRQVEAIFPDERSLTVSQSELPLTLTQGEGQAMVERWLAEARVARDGARFALPPSGLGLSAGDVIGLDDNRYRIDRVEQGAFQQIDAVRVEAASYSTADAVERRATLAPVAAATPVAVQFLDLPLLRGTEVEHAPHVAAYADPWPGPVAIWSSDEDAGYRLNRLLTGATPVGVTEAPLRAARTGVLDQGAPLRVRVVGPGPTTAPLSAILNGRNAAAIGDGSPDRWEVFQFAAAELVGPETWELSGRLRGQAGTDGLMPDVWPEGSLVVFLETGLEQIDLAPGARGLARHYRSGIAGLGYGDSETLHQIEAFAGIGLRPYRPVHLRARADASGLVLSWIRRTRIDGDSWESPDVPLGEDREVYRVTVSLGGTALRTVEVYEPAWTYGVAAQEADGFGSGCHVEVSQLSTRFGPGLPARLAF
jgi:hypothetical protein